MKNRWILFVLALFLLCGCSTTYDSKAYNTFSIGKASGSIRYRVFQTINSHFALAEPFYMSSSSTVVAIQTSAAFDPFYDGEIIKGSFVMIDTYSYETVPDKYGRTLKKTVPLIVPKRDYVNSL